MNLTIEQMRVKIAVQNQTVDRLTSEINLLRSALVDRQIVLGEVSLEAPEKEESTDGDPHQ